MAVSWGGGLGQLRVGVSFQGDGDGLKLITRLAVLLCKHVKTTELYTLTEQIILSVNYILKALPKKHEYLRKRVRRCQADIFNDVYPKPNDPELLGMLAQGGNSETDLSHIKKTVMGKRLETRL